MEGLIITLGGSGVVGLFFLIWLYTKSGKKWLANL
jgi:hypothetical protein